MSGDLTEAWADFLPLAERAALVKLGEQDGADYIQALTASWEAGGAPTVTAFLSGSRTQEDFDADIAALWEQATGSEVRREKEAATYSAGAYVEAVAEDIQRVAEAAAGLGEGIISAAEGGGAALKAGGEAAKGSPFTAAVVASMVIAGVAAVVVYIGGKAYRVW